MTEYDTMPQRYALVTGASGGIGRPICERLVEEGYRLVVSGRSSQKVDGLVHELTAMGADVTGVVADLADPRSVNSLADRTLASVAQLDLMVLAAGVGAAGLLENYPLSRLDLQWSVNVRSAFLLVQRLLPALRTAAEANRDRGAKVVAIASLTGVVSEPGLAAYGASKAALISLCESINVSESQSGIAATALAPGYVDAGMSEWVHNRIDPEAMIRSTDIVELVVAITRLSRNAVVPAVLVTRPGEQLWRA